jgi:hypothetical protein
LLIGAPDPAARAFSAGLLLDPELESVHYFLALARLGQKRTEEARDLLKKIDKKDPLSKPAKALLKTLETQK